MAFSEKEIVENFAELYRQLIAKSPHLAVHNFHCENSNYSDQLNDSFNAYVCFNGYGLQDCYYNFDSRWNKDCTDLSFSNNSELCYNCIDCEACYNSDFCQDCERCTDCYYCYECIGCTDCFGCVGLRRAKFMIGNVQYSQEDYHKKISELKKLPEEKIRQVLEDLRLKIPHVAFKATRSENSIGDYMFNARNTQYAFKAHDLEDCAYAYDSNKLKDSVDVAMIHNSQLMYESTEATDNYNCNFLYWSANCRDSEYIMYCFNANNCFGCFNLKHKEFHVLNQPYEKEQYFRLIAAIKEKLRQTGSYNNFLPDVI